MTEELPHIPPTDENLEKLVHALTERFPAEQDEVQAIVHRHFEELSADAPVDAYLLQLTEGKATDELRSRHPAHDQG